MTLDDLLDAAVAAVPGGVRRDGQHEMAHAVQTASSTGEHLLVQAGTGTGKSLAYLAAALHTRRRVVVSTATLALQAQLVDSDLPRLADAVSPVLGRRPTYALVKGRHHYLCLARLEGSNADDSGEGLFDDDDGPTWLAQAGRLGQQMTRIREWATSTEQGDRTELDPGVDDAAWRLVSMPARECIGAQRCPFGEECFAEAARTRAKSADIVVTNHSLLAIDMLNGRQILPEHDLLVIDEAHELVDRVTSAAQAELSGDLVHRAARRIRPHVDALVFDRLEEAADLLRIGLEGTAVGRLLGLPDGLRETLTVVDAACRLGLDAVGDISTDDPDAVMLQQAKALVDGVSDTAQRLLAEDEHDVAWTTRDDRSGRHALFVAPLGVSAQLGTHLYRHRTVVATSATLALGGRFDVVARSLGLDPRFGCTPSTMDSRPAEPPEPAGEDDPIPVWRALDVGSPFDYPRQGVLYVAAHLPRPTTSGLTDAAQAELVELVTAAGGRTLGLFSSRKAAAQAAEVLREKTQLPVLVQGEDSLNHLVRRFREDPSACLLGVMSLWQGVDVPGPACQLVVIDRLPFPRPDDPLMAARSKAVDDAGGSGFAAVSVPVAAVRLAQGAGRLVRGTGDRGVVAVLDSRLHAARYGDFLRRSLPPFWYTTSRDTVLGALRRLDAEPVPVQG